MNWLQKQ